MSAEATGWVWRHSPYTAGAALVVHLAIADVVNDAHGFEFWMTTENLAEKARCSRSSTVSALRRMVADGLLEVVEKGGGRGRGTRFRFLMPAAEAVWETGQITDAKLRDLGPETARSGACKGITQGTEEHKGNRPNLAQFRDADPNCAQCQGRGVKGYALVGEKMDRTAEVPCDCTHPDYQPTPPHASRPPAGFGLPARRGA